MSDINPANAENHKFYCDARSAFRAAITPQAQAAAARLAAYYAPCPSLAASWELKASRARAYLVALLTDGARL